MLKKIIKYPVWGYILWVRKGMVILNVYISLLMILKSKPFQTNGIFHKATYNKVRRVHCIYIEGSTQATIFKKYYTPANFVLGVYYFQVVSAVCVPGSFRKGLFP